jgi:periplasmic protein TonB
MSQETLPPALADGVERRRLGTFFAASLALHVAAIIAFPDFSQEVFTAQPSVLEVTILKPQPLPVAPAVTEAQPPQPQAKPEPVPAKELSKPERSDAAPVLALTKPDPLEGSFRVAPSRLPEPAPAPDPAVQAASAVVTPPGFDAAYLSNPAPAYPPAARRAGEQGTVTLRVLVTREGLPSRVEIEKSSGSKNLDAAARDSVWGWRFVPARQGTDPIESWVLVPVVFRLDGSG